MCVSIFGFEFGRDVGSSNFTNGWDECVESFPSDGNVDGVRKHSFGVLIIVDPGGL